MMKDMKLSLHPRRWRMALTTQAAARHLPEGSDRVLARWDVPADRWPGWRLAAAILTPAITFTAPFNERRPSDGGPILWFPAPTPPEHLRFYVLLGEPDAGLAINNVIGDVGRMTLSSGLRVWIVADAFTVTAEHQRHIEDIRRAMALHPDAACGWAWGEVEGIPNLLDLAALRPATAGAPGPGGNYLARVRLDPTGEPAIPATVDDLDDTRA